VYRKVMSGFAQYLTTAMKSQSTAATTTTVESITITPLVEGSFTVWKVVLSVVNGSGASLVSLSPSFGLPALRLDGAVASGPSASLGELFAMYFTKTYLASTLDPQPELSQVVTGPPQSLLGASGLVLFTTDVMRAGCISYAQHVALGDNGVATPEMLQHPCPLPNQYTIVANDTAKTDLLNPLWSPCTTSATTGATHLTSSAMNRCWTRLAQARRHLRCVKSSSLSRLCWC
jgi:hypothetical protein